MTEQPQPSKAKRIGKAIFNVIFVLWISAAIITGGVVYIDYVEAERSTPILEAELIAQNEKSATYKILDSRGANGEPLRWSEVEFNLITYKYFQDSNDIMNVNEQFSVKIDQDFSDMTYVIEARLNGTLLWSDAFYVPDDRIVPITEIPVPGTGISEVDAALNQTRPVIKSLWDYVNDRDRIPIFND